MNERSRQVALRIAALLEEFTGEEIRDALALLSGRPAAENLQALLNPPLARSTARRERRSPASRKGESRVMHQLKLMAPEKYRALAEFEAQIRHGAVLRDLEDVRAFARSIDKSFSPGKSRKDSIGRLIVSLARLDVEAITRAVARASAPTTREGSYERLAEHLLTRPTTK